MTEKHLARAMALANRLGHDKLYTEVDFEDYIPLSDGCSGYLSKLYSRFDRAISCERCCNAHDWLYELGGGRLARLRADLFLCRCAASAGSFPAGVAGWPRRAWRWLRSWILFSAVRCFGGPYFAWG